MQSLMVGISGYELTAREREILCHPLIGGVILFARNYQSPEQLTALTASIHALRSPQLLIAVDQEGGRVQRFKNGFTLLPAPKRCGECYDKNPQAGVALAENCGELMAMELLSCGVDLSFAPVLDVDDGRSKVIGDRAFHHDPKVAAILGKAYVNGMSKAGMKAVGKHFPGHGSVVNDTHLDSAVDHRPWQEIATHDLVPFIAAIDAGIAGMMVAHVIYSGLDKIPAGFSKVCVTDLMRKQLGFQGAVFSDDMGMMAAKHFGSTIAGIEAALAAGCDMVLLCNEPHVIEKAIRTLIPHHDPDRVARIQSMRAHNSTMNYADLSQNKQWLSLSKEIQFLLAKIVS